MPQCLKDAVSFFLKEVMSVSPQQKYTYVAFVTPEDSFEIFEAVGVPLEHHHKTPLLLRNGFQYGIFGHTTVTCPSVSRECIVILSLFWELENMELHYNHLLSAMFHEIRNPITGILNTTDLLLTNPALPSQWRASIELIEASTTHLLTLSGDLLDFHRLKQGQLEILPQSNSVEACLQNVAQLLARPPQFNIRLAIHSQVPKTLCFDQARLSQVLINLVNNSRKFGGHNVTIRCAAQVPKVYFEVEDDGIGIDKAVQKTIFQYRQANTQTGLGLGLLICKKIVQLMQGNIFIKRSEVNQGTTMAFFFSVLPTGPPENLPESSLSDMAASAVVAKKKKQKILIVDDSRFVNESIRNMILSITDEVDVRIAADGLEAIATNREFRPDLIFMDIRMPKLDGWKAIEQILKEPVLPIIYVISAYTLSAAEQEVCRQWKLAGYIRKPFKIEDLSRCC